VATTCGPVNNAVAVKVVQQMPPDLNEYARIAIAYDVRQIVDVVAPPNGLASSRDRLIE
jgi:hypothetical protein